MADPRVVVLFGTSANPPTGLGGHAGMVRWAALEARIPELGGARPDQVWVLPVYVHAYEEKRDLERFEHRLAMARLAFEHLPGVERGRVQVLELERELAEATDARLGTIDVVRALEARYPETRFVLLLGADTYRDLAEDRWKESEALKARVHLLVVPRPEQVEGVTATPGAPRLAPVSSSAVRASEDPEVWDRALQAQVLAYAKAHGLYGLR